MSIYYRMLRQIPKYPIVQLPDPQLPPNITIVPYVPALHHEVVPQVYAAAFGEPPWPADWETIPEFDPGGVFLAISTESGEAGGFAVSFMRREYGYISVVAAEGAGVAAAGHRLGADRCGGWLHAYQGPGLPEDRCRDGERGGGKSV